MFDKLTLLWYNVYINWGVVLKCYISSIGINPEYKKQFGQDLLK